MSNQYLVAIDACILINFIRIGRFDLLINYPGIRFIVTGQVLAELTDPAQAAVVIAALDDGSMERYELVGVEPLKRFAELELTMGRGEASAIAAAEFEGWYVATDEGGRARRTINEGACAGRLMTTPGLLLQLIRISILTVDEADQVKANLAAHRFAMNFNSFQDLL